MRLLLKKTQLDIRSLIIRKPNLSLLMRRALPHLSLSLMRSSITWPFVKGYLLELIGIMSKITFTKTEKFSVF